MTQNRSLRQVAQSLRSGATTSRALTDEYISAISTVDNSHSTYTKRNFEAARQTADRFDLLPQDSPYKYVNVLSGIPCGIKNLFDLPGIKATANSQSQEHKPLAPAQLSLDLEAFGIPVLGLQTCHELAFGPTGDFGHPVPAQNPVNPQIIPGGSSSGSAVAVRQGLAPYSIATDTGGSIRTPAAINGLVGFKPGTNIANTSNMIHLDPELDRIGPIARDVEDTYLAFRSLEGKSLEECDLDPDPPSSIGILAGTFWDNVQPDISQVLHTFLQRVFDLARVIEVPCSREAQDAQLAQATMVSRSAWERHCSDAASHPEHFGAEVLGRIQGGQSISEAQVDSARRASRNFESKVLQALERRDVLMTVTNPIVAPTVGTRVSALPQGEDSTFRAITQFTSPFSVTTLPVLTLPIGKISEANFVGVQLIGQPGNEQKLFSHALYLERMLKHDTN